jgi:hypothetical protein
MYRYLLEDEMEVFTETPEDLKVLEIFAQAIREEMEDWAEVSNLGVTINLDSMEIAIEGIDLEDNAKYKHWSERVKREEIIPYKLYGSYP